LKNAQSSSENAQRNVKISNDLILSKIKNGV